MLKMRGGEEWQGWLGDGFIAEGAMSSEMAATMAAIAWARAGGMDSDMGARTGGRGNVMA